MSNYTIKIPDIGEGITEVEIVEWFVQVGQPVAEDQKVASVMTDKVSVDITSPVAGTVASLGGAAGEILAVGADLVDIALSTTSATPMVESESESESESVAGEPGAESLAAVSVPSPSEQPESQTKNQAPVDSTPIKSAEAAPAATTTPHERLLHKVQASPAVRKRAARLSIDLPQLAQRLQKNHLTHADLDQQLAGAQGTSTFSSSVATGGVHTVPVRGLRRQIAKKMLESSQSIPHFSYVEAIDVTDLETWRQQLNQHWAEQRGHLTLLPFLVRAMCLAVQKHPEVNARYDAEQNTLQQYEDVHIAIATQTNEGLMVPVLEHAQQLSLWEIASNIHDLAQAARAGTGNLSAKSTITLSSLGALGGVVATPIINAPEVAIVGVNKQIRTPVVIDEQIQIRTMMNLSSSFDHRFVDGMHAAEFIQTVRTLLEKPHIYLVD